MLRVYYRVQICQVCFQNFIKVSIYVSTFSISYNLLLEIRNHWWAKYWYTNVYFSVSEDLDAIGAHTGKLRAQTGCEEDYSDIKYKFVWAAV